MIMESLLGLDWVEVIREALLVGSASLILY